MQFPKRRFWVFFALFLFYAGGGSLLIGLFVRLFATSHFGGDVSKLDFGPKTTSSSEIGKNSTSNEAFAPEFNSAGHMLQAVLIVFAASIIPKSWPVWIALLSYLASLGSIVYPVYNSIKRFKSAGPSFARSSYCNNALEWGMGFLLGCILSAIVGGLLQFFNVQRHSRSGRIAPCTKFPVRVFHVQMFFGALMLIFCYAALIYFAATWNYDILNDGPVDAAGAALVVVLPAIFVAVSFGVGVVYYLKCSGKSSDESDS